MREGGLCVCLCCKNWKSSWNESFTRHVCGTLSMSLKISDSKDLSWKNLFRVPSKLLHLESVCERLRNVRLFARSSLRILCWPSWVLSRWMGLQQSRCAPKVPSLQIALLYLLFANWQYVANICNLRSCAAFSRCHKRQICAKLENLHAS